MADLTDFDTGETTQLMGIITSSMVILGIVLMALTGIQQIQAGVVQDGVLLFATSILFGLILVVSVVGFQFANVVGGVKFTELFLDDFEDVSTSLFLGFVFWTALLKFRAGELFSSIGGGLKSIIPEFPLSSVTLSVSPSLSDAKATYINGVVAPIVEELFFFLMGPALLTVFLVKVFDFEELTAAVVSILGFAGIFASYHLQEPAFSAFWIAAFIFGGITRLGPALDFYTDWLPGFALFGLFSIGAHIANNVHQLGGVVEVWTTISQNTLIAVFVAVFAGSVVFGTVQNVLQWLEGN